MGRRIGGLCYHSSVSAVADTNPVPNDARVSFLAFLYSLAGSAAVHFGDVADPAAVARLSRGTTHFRGSKKA